VKAEEQSNLQEQALPMAAEATNTKAPNPILGDITDPEATKLPGRKARAPQFISKRINLKGGPEDLKGFIYDVVVAKGGVAYTRTTEEIARYVGKKYTTTGTYIRTGILTLVVPAPARPNAPVATGTPAMVNAVDLEIFKEKVHMYVKIEASIERTMKSLYDLIWGQCSESLRS
jgi:hypothetical protein